MTYKDDLEAAHERIRALEREVSQLRGAAGRPDAEGRDGPGCLGRPHRRPDLAGWTVVVLVGLFAVASLGIGVPRRPLLAPGLVALATLVLLLLIIRRRLVARPCEVLVLTGHDRRQRVIAPGKAGLRPFGTTELRRLDLRPLPVRLSLRPDGERHTLSVHALVGVASDTDSIERAAASLLGQDRQEIGRRASAAIAEILQDERPADDDRTALQRRVDQALRSASGLTLLSLTLQPAPPQGARQ